jgi:hypothetical protein
MSHRLNPERTLISTIRLPLVACSLLALLPLLGLGCDSGDSPCVTTAGVTIEVGESFTQDDGCNSCVCEDGGAFVCTARACATTCSYNNLTHSVGDTFPETDGCNTCTCEADGSVACTALACAETCDYDSQSYDVDDTFAATDGCNTCTCETGGTVSCTATVCTETCDYDSQSYDVDDTFAATDGCNTCTCETGGIVSCTEQECPSTCEYDRVWYDEGDVYPQGDGCNDCTCQFDGVSACTKRACFFICSDEIACEPERGTCLEPGGFVGCDTCQTPAADDICVDDRGCDTGEICTNSVEDCACGGEKTCRPGCTTNANCAEGQACEADGRCGTATCGEDACPANFRCDAGGCLRKGCSVDTDCDGSCVGGRCYSGPGMCTLLAE